MMVYGSIPCLAINYDDGMGRHAWSQGRHVLVSVQEGHARFES